VHTQRHLKELENLLHLLQAAQALTLTLTGLDVFITALAQHDRRLIRIVDPLTVFHEIF
jgi:hypothetical protein